MKSNRDTDWHERVTRQTRRPRRLEEANSVEVGFPLAWILIGAVAGLLVIGLVGLGVINIVRKQSITPTPPTIPGLAPTLPIADEGTPGTPLPALAATPTIPPVVTLPPTPTLIPTETPVPVAPTTLAPGVYALVEGTETSGLSLRAGPGTNNARLGVAVEGSLVLLVDGPREDENQEDYTWWFVRAEDGSEGWAVENFMKPSLPPAPSQ